MKDIKEALDKKPKRQQLLLLLMMCVGIFSILCVSGCGGKSCETIKYGKEGAQDETIKGCSIPGCGGILNSGRGCNSACWPQSCKYINYSNKETTKSNIDTNGYNSIKACDIKYYGGGCLGCNQQEKSSYFGFAKYTDSTGDKNDVKGCFYGNSESGKMFGCVGGGVGCINTGTGSDVLDFLESYVGVD